MRDIERHDDMKKLLLVLLTVFLLLALLPTSTAAVPTPVPAPTPEGEYVVFQNVLPNRDVLMVEIQGGRCRVSLWGHTDVRGRRVLEAEPLVFELLDVDLDQMPDDVRDIPEPPPAEKPVGEGGGKVL